jgi:hypothetical protein
MADIVTRDSWFVKKFFMVLFGVIITNQLNAAVGLCVKDDSLAKVAAVNTNNANGNGWVGGFGGERIVRSTDGQYTVSGIAACLDTKTPPMAWISGTNCWCKVTSINNKSVPGAAIFNVEHGSYIDCFSNCAFNCSSCIRVGTSYSCTRSALFAAP